MLEFPEDYFQAETREDFLVDATMKTVWAAELEVLNEVAVICGRHDLQWYAAYGTLLGAVRHEGFIPWDDDIDIWMRRQDYRTLMELLPKELPSEYVVHSPHQAPGYPEFQVYVDNGDSISIEPERLERFHGCPFYVGIDIFPLDDIPADPGAAGLQRGIFAATMLLQQLEFERTQQPGKRGAEIEMQKAVSKVLELAGQLQSQYGIRIDRELVNSGHQEAILEHLWLVAERLSKVGGCHELASYRQYITFETKFKTAWFDDVAPLPFEGFMVPAPKGYDEILRVLYKDYTVRVRGANAHNYPCYKRQLEELRRLAGAIQDSPTYP